MKFIFIISVILFSFVTSDKLSADSFEQCAPVNFIMGQLGVVNVLAFLDDSWAYSHKQASMLKLLKDRLEHSGLPASLFFVITSESPSNPFENISEEEIEKEAWEGVAPDEAMELSSELLPPDSLEKAISSDIFLIEDNEELGIWRELHGSRDQVLVIDRCGRLAYQIIVPWSILHFPYVKAAILSTHKDNPCGPCDVYATVVDFNQVTDDFNKKADVEVEDITEENLETTTNPPELNFDDASTGEENNEEELLPSLRIIMHAPHYHLNTDSSKHEYLVMESDKPDYHGHLDVSTYQFDDRSEEKIVRTLLESIVFGKDESPGLYGEVADYWRDGGEGEKSEHIVASGDGEQGEISSTITPGNFENGVTNFADFTVEEEESKSRLIAHYSRLLPWIYYILND